MKIFEITLLFLGSVIGAGFATGAEIVTFFGDVHLPIWLIACIIGLTMFGIIVLEIWQNHHQEQNQNTPQTKTNKMITITEIASIFIYFILFTAMTAGVTSITNVGITVISLIASAGIVLFGFSKLSRINVFIVLTIIVLIISTALPHFFTSQSTVNLSWNHLPNGIFWGFLYAGLNCFMFPELIKAAAQKHKKSTLLWAGVLTAVFITILVGLILTTIKNADTETAPIPLLAAAPNGLTIVIILLAILTSQYTALFAIVQRTQKFVPKLKNRPLLSMIGICTLAFFCSFLGFNQIVNFAYPLIGAFTCVFLLISWVKH